MDHVHYNTKTQKTSVVTTDDNYDELYVDGKYVGNSGQGGWKTYAPDAQVFGEYSFGFYNAAYGSMLRNDNVFSRLYKNAPSQAAQGNLFKASISNRDPTILYATLATPVAIIGAGEVLGSIAAEESYTLFQLGRGKNFRIDFDWRNAIHYHRRAAGGIGRHRPWQVKPGDLGNFWKRF